MALAELDEAQEGAPLVAVRERMVLRQAQVEASRALRKHVSPCGSPNVERSTAASAENVETDVRQPADDCRTWPQDHRGDDDDVALVEVLDRHDAMRRAGPVDSAVGEVVEQRAMPLDRCAEPCLERGVVTSASDPLVDRLPDHVRDGTTLDVRYGLKRRVLRFV